MGTPLLSLLLLLFFPSSPTLACDWCGRRTKAAFFSSSDDLSAGSCGYGSMATQLNGGHVAAGSPVLFGQADACGGCYEVRCSHARLCSKQGAKVVLIDTEKGRSQAGFVLSKEAFMAMAEEGASHGLMALETVDVEFRRIPCEYKKNNLSIRVEESSRKPSHLSMTFLYQGGQTHIAAVDVAQVGSSEWRSMTQQRKGRPVWSTGRAPEGPLQFRLVVTAGSGGKWVWSEEEVLPMGWKVGEVYSTGVQIGDIAHEGACSPCDTRNKWRRLMSK